MVISSRTPEGEPNRCPVCGHHVNLEPSRPPGDAPGPVCGSLLWFPSPQTTPLVCARVVSRAPEEVEFDPDRWRVGSLRSRGAQAPNLIRRGLLNGLGQERVAALLGEPDERGKGWWGYALDRGVRITYRGSPHRLRVRFGADGRACDALVTERVERG